MIKKSIVIIFLLCFSVSVYAGDNDDASTIFFATSISGGGSGSLDGAVSGVSIGPNDAAVVVDSGLNVSIYKVILTDPSENIPSIILPDDVGVGVTAWSLCRIISGVSTEDTIVGGVSVYNLTSSQTMTREMMGGSYIGNYGASSEITVTLLTAFRGASFNISLDQDISSGSTLNIILPSGDKIINYPDFVAGSGSGTSYWYLSGTTGESITFVGKDTGIWRVWTEGTLSQETGS